MDPDGQVLRRYSKAHQTRLMESLNHEAVLSLHDKTET